MLIKTRKGWKEITSPNIVPAPKQIDRGYRTEAEVSRDAFIHGRFMRMFETADGKNSFDTGRFYYLSHDPADLHS